jgi:hypothetical protein
MVLGVDKFAANGKTYFSLTAFCFIKEEMTNLENFIQWVSTHTLTSILIAGTVYAIFFIIAHRKALFYKE